MSDTSTSRDHASTKKSNPYTTGNSASQRTAQLNANPIVLINDSDRTLAAKSINRPRPNTMPTDAAKDIIASFVASLQHAPAQEAFVQIGNEFVLKWAQYYNDSKSIIRLSANHALISKSYAVSFPFQVPKRLENDPDFMGILNVARDDAAKAMNTNHHNYIKAVTAVNKSLKVELLEFIARSLPVMSKIVLITHNAAEYGPHNLVADTFALSQREILSHFTTLEIFMGMYKRENKCGRAPEDAKALLDRLTPSARAVVEKDVNESDAEIPPNPETNTPIVPIDTTPKSNLKCPVGIYNKQEDTSAITESSGNGFISALDLLNKAETEGFDMITFLKGIAQSEGNPLQKRNMGPPPTVINTPAPSKESALAVSTVFSPLRTLKQPQTNKFYFTRNYSTSELKAIIGSGTEDQKLHRCKRLVLLDSIREDNYVEGSLFSSVSSESTDSPAKRLFTSLEEVDYEPFNHSEACSDLLDAIRWLFLQPRASFINQYMHNLTARDLKKSQVGHKLTTLADKSAERLESEKESAKSPTTEGTIIAAVDNKVEKKLNKQQKQKDEATNEILDQLAIIRRELQVERSQRLQSEKELQQLKTSLESKEEVPTSDSGTVETIESDRAKPQKSNTTVQFELPPTKKHRKAASKQRHPKNRNGHQQNVHKRAEKRRRKRDEATDAERDISNANSSLNPQLSRDPSRSNKRKKNRVWTRQNDTRKP